MEETCSLPKISTLMILSVLTLITWNIAFVSLAVEHFVVGEAIYLAILFIWFLMALPAALLAVCIVLFAKHRKKLRSGRAKTIWLVLLLLINGAFYPTLFVNGAIGLGFPGAQKLPSSLRSNLEQKKRVEQIENRLLSHLAISNQGENFSFTIQSIRPGGADNVFICTVLEETQQVYFEAYCNPEIDTVLWDNLSGQLAQARLNKQMCQLINACTGENSTLYVRWSDRAWNNLPAHASADWILLGLYGQLHFTPEIYIRAEEISYEHAKKIYFSILKNYCVEGMAVDFYGNTPQVELSKVNFRVYFVDAEHYQNWDVTAPGTGDDLYYASISAGPLENLLAEQTGEEIDLEALYTAAERYMDEHCRSGFQ